MKTKTIKELRDKHRREIEEFQKKCKHSDISGWIDEWWAPGHSTGKQVKVCNICEKVVEATKSTFGVIKSE
jgi:hypothetical protein